MILSPHEVPMEFRPGVVQLTLRPPGPNFPFGRGKLDSFAALGAFEIEQTSGRGLIVVNCYMYYSMYVYIFIYIDVYTLNIFVCFPLCECLKHITSGKLNKVETFALSIHKITKSVAAPHLGKLDFAKQRWGGLSNMEFTQQEIRTWFWVAVEIFARMKQFDICQIQRVKIHVRWSDDLTENQKQKARLYIREDVKTYLYKIS